MNNYAKQLAGVASGTAIALSVFLYLWLAVVLGAMMLDSTSGQNSFLAACLLAGFALLCGVVSAILRLQTIQQDVQKIREQATGWRSAGSAPQFHP